MKKGLREILRKIYFCGGDKLREEKDLDLVEAQISNLYEPMGEEEIEETLSKLFKIEYNGNVYIRETLGWRVCLPRDLYLVIAKALSSKLPKPEPKECGCNIEKQMLGFNIDTGYKFCMTCGLPIPKNKLEFPYWCCSGHIPKLKQTWNDPNDKITHMSDIHSGEGKSEECKICNPKQTFTEIEKLSGFHPGEFDFLVIKLNEIIDHLNKMGKE